MKQILQYQSRADYLDITGSVRCVTHYLITSVLVISSTLLPHDMLRIDFLSLDYVFILLNVGAVGEASRYASPRIQMSLWGFLSLFATGLLREDVHDEFECVAYAASQA